jgi:Domain of unknown function (DUF4337)
MEAEDVKEYMHQEHVSRGDERFRKLSAMLVGIFAALLAINGLGGANATKEMINNNVLSADTFSFYQAKTVRQTVYRVAADELEITLLGQSNMPELVRDKIKQRYDRYWKTIERYDSEPETGEGRKELLAKAVAYEAKRDHAERQDPYFDLAAALFQIAIVLCSVAILSGARILLGAGVVTASLAAVLMLNGFFLFSDMLLGGAVHH